MTRRARVRVAAASPMWTRHRQPVMAQDMNRGRLQPALWARIAETMAMFAVAVRLFIPVGFMLEAPAQPGALPAIVVCTGHGALTVHADEVPGRDGGAAPDPGKQNAHEPPCAFAGHGATVSPPVLAPLILAWTDPRAASALQPAVRQSPGQGLPAPPPPARGPPRLI